MRFLDRLIFNSYFRRSSDGLLLFFPLAYISPGYIIPSDAEYNRILHTYRIMLIVILPLVALATVLASMDTLSEFTGFLLFCGVLLIILLVARIQCRNLERTNVYMNYGTNSNKKFFTYLLTAGKFAEPVVIICFGFLVLLLVHNKASDQDIASALGAFLIACTGLITQKIIEKWREKRMRTM